jgi:putative MATE family efflux protein
MPAVSYSRQILHLAIPAFLTLVAEPLFLLGDSAIVGHLGTPQLAALGVAGTIVTTIVGLCVFLAYGTTAAVARSVGAGDRRRALHLGVDGMWLAVLVGVVSVVILEVAAQWVVEPFGAGADVAADALGYIRIAAFGVPALLVVLASTGVLRGFADTRTPLVVTVITQLLNIGANLLLVYGIGSWNGLGLRGSALGTVIAQTLGAIAFAGVVVRLARRHDVSLRPDLPGVRAAGATSVPLIIRTLTLRIALLSTVLVASGFGPAALAAHQVAMNVWNLLALALDAVAIAAQTITGQSLGAGDSSDTRAVTRTMLKWGVGAGIVLGLLLLAGHRVIPALFTPDPAVRSALATVLLIAAVWQPVNGVVFVLDGVLIGAGDARYLAVAGLITLVVFVPLLLLVWRFDAGLPWLWWAYGAFMLARMATLLYRERGDTWLRLGAALP